MKKQNYSMAAKASAGFTMIELMVVIVILGVLGGLVAVNVFENVDKSRVQAAKTDISTIAQALDLFKLDNFKYPTTDMGLDALVNQPDGARGWPTNGYIKKEPLDPWDTPYGYISSDGQSFELYSFGADASQGGEGTAADISMADL
ncbi:MAG: type II secretion system protein GspG [Moraxellaceae bacterium]|nr:MAG: type II secretion system protein GspG [Moraxellaceae bacterium]